MDLCYVSKHQYTLYVINCISTIYSYNNNIIDVVRGGCPKRAICHFQRQRDDETKGDNDASDNIKIWR